MTSSSLVWRNLRFHWRAHLGVLLGATLGAAVLVGALAVGDSVRYSLLQMALMRLGGVHVALSGGSRFFRAKLADDLARDLNAAAAPVVYLRGTVSSGDSTGDERRANSVQVLGVDEFHFWPLAPHDVLTPSGEDAALINDRLAARLGVKLWDEIVIRVDKPSLLSRDAPLSTIEDSTVSFRMKVVVILSDFQFGNFSLDANQVPPLNVFVPLGTLQRKIGMIGRANLLLVGKQQWHSDSDLTPHASRLTPESATQTLWKHWEFTDSGLDVCEAPAGNAIQLGTDRVFLETTVADAALKAYPGARGILTYFVNELRIGGRSTPYSTVCAIQGPPVPNDLGADEILINRWLADDLQAKPGNLIKLTYWLMGPNRKLIEHATEFKVRAILPMEGVAADPSLMPPIPGLADKKNCRDWEPGVPIDLKRIRDKDQDYWSKYRGTPKAFISLAAGQRIWNNRFGNFTAVRYPGNAATKRTVESCLRQALSPGALGLYFAPVRERALAASANSLDFGQLFLGFSFFLIVAALLLTALLFGFGVEQRAEESGILLALGFTSKRVRRLLMLEGGAIALVASILGALSAVVYTGAIVRALTTVWRGAVANSSLQFHTEASTLAGGAAAAFIAALFSIWLVARKQAQAPPRSLLAGADVGANESQRNKKRGATPDVAVNRPLRLPGLPTATVCLILAVALLALAPRGSSESAAETFFVAGGLLLIGGIAGCRAYLARLERRAAGLTLTVNSLGIRNTTRRRTRSLAAIALLACGTFLVIAVGASRQDPSSDASRRDSGTGGFAFYGESSLPVYQDLNSPEGRESYNLDASTLAGVKIVPLRLKEGDEASCLNLNRAQTPRVLGVSPAQLGDRGAFTFQSIRRQAIRPEREAGSPWLMLDSPEPDGAIPAIGDANTVKWSLGKGLGDVVPYTDEQGRSQKLRIIGVLANSILQGGLVISESNFIRLFPSVAGYQVFLVDASGSGQAARRELTRGLEDAGLSLTPAVERLADFGQVENTYLSIFAILGGLGLLLGSAGLGVIVLRNVLERRGELALLRAVGFRKGTLRRLVFSEHVLLLALGLLVGVVAALVAVIPSLRSPGVHAPYASLSLNLLAVLISGIAWTWLATSVSLRGPLLRALSNE